MEQIFWQMQKLMKVLIWLYASFCAKLTMYKWSKMSLDVY